ncbi:MAG: HEPN domain-containing protein [Anaerolineae bacterium]|nr:HEPN domain-containing protein [Anaerolineae bacterium]
MERRKRSHVLKEERVKYLTDHEREALSRLLDRLEAEFPDGVQRVILFGSRARGEHDTESDIDLLIVSDEDKSRIANLAREATANANLPLSPLVVSTAEYRRYQRLRLPLYVNLRRAGIELWDTQQAMREQQEIPLHFPEGERRTMDEATKDTIAFYMEQAHHNLRGVHLLQDNGLLDIALSRAYYACFYALTAALYAINVVRDKHSGVRDALSQFLVKPGLVEAEYKDIYNALKEKRESSDYDPRFVADPEEATRLLADAERFVARMEAFLEELGAFA